MLLSAELTFIVSTSGKTLSKHMHITELKQIELKHTTF